jgi:hypothetical protein
MGALDHWGRRTGVRRTLRRLRNTTCFRRHASAFSCFPQSYLHSCLFHCLSHLNSFRYENKKPPISVKVIYHRLR